MRINQSGCSDLNIQDKAKEDFEAQYKKPFTHVRAWNILKEQPKWLEQPVIGVDSSGSSKKRKSSDSNNAPTPQSEPNEAFNVPLPCLNEDPAPSRQSKGKKKANDESSSRSTTHESIKNYTAAKESLLRAQLEVQRKKDEEYFKFLENENMRNDMKFVMDPHEHILDPAFKEFIINKKKEICEKWGWPTSL